MEQSAKHGFTNATDAADYLVNHGVPFRDGLEHAREVVDRGEHAGLAVSVAGGIEG